MADLTPDLLARVVDAANAWPDGDRFWPDVLLSLVAAARERDQLRVEVGRLHEVGRRAASLLEAASDVSARREWAREIRAEIERES